VALGTIWRMLHVQVVAAKSLQFVQDLKKRPHDKITPRAAAVAPLLSILQRRTSVSATIARLISPTSMASFALLSKKPTACLLWPLLVWVRLLSRYDKPSGSATYQNQKTQSTSAATSSIGKVAVITAARVPPESRCSNIARCYHNENEP
jgi:hypothetical protein